MTTITVPATSANLGCGFDSVGLALDLQLRLTLGSATADWEIRHDLGPAVAADARNLVVATALSLAPDLAPHAIHMTSDIPLEHGLGSSSTAIVAGILLADALGQLGLSSDERLAIACQLEGHPDNVAPALLGGLVAASYDPATHSVSAQRLPAPDCAIVATIPAYNVSTAQARRALPKHYSRQTAVTASSRANVLIAALANGDLTAAGRMMEQDLLHEPYRAALVPELAQVREIAHQHEAYGTYLSGAGSTILTLLPKNQETDLIQALQAFGQIKSLTIDKKGAQIKND